MKDKTSEFEAFRFFLIFSKMFYGKAKIRGRNFRFDKLLINYALNKVRYVFIF